MNKNTNDFSHSNRQITGGYFPPQCYLAGSWAALFPAACYICRSPALSLVRLPGHLSFPPRWQAASPLLMPSSPPLTELAHHFCLLVTSPMLCLLGLLCPHLCSLCSFLSARFYPHLSISRQADRKARVLAHGAGAAPCSLVQDRKHGCLGSQGSA